jgi:putative transposase
MNDVLALRHRMEVGFRFLLNGRDMTVTKNLGNKTYQVKDMVTEQLSGLSEAELVESLFQGNLTPVYYNGQMKLVEQKALHAQMTDLSLLPDSLKNEVRNRHTYVQAYLRASAEKISPLTGQEMTDLIATVAAELNDLKPPSPLTLSRWKTRFRRSGADVRSLIPRYRFRGVHGYLRADYSPEDQLKRKLKEVMDEAIEEKYLTPEKWPITSVHEHLKMKINELNQGRTPENQLATPHINTLRNRIAKLDKYEVTARREGEDKAVRLFKPIGQGPIATRPLERIEIDHTKLDLIVVDEETRIPIGRPWLTLAIDKATRMVVGFYLSFTPPSALSVLACLKHCIAPKFYLQELFPDILNDWPVYGVPEMIVVDNGMDLLSANFRDACLMLGIIIQQAPPGVPWYKGPIERFFGTHNTQLVHLQKGTTFSNIFDRDEYVPAKHAVISLTTLNQLMHHFIVDVYHQSPHRGLKRVPAAVWQELVAKYPPALPPDKQTLDVWLGYTEFRTLSNKGIELHNLRYNCKAMETLLRTGGKRVEVKVKFDPSNLSVIYVADEQRGEFIAVPALDQVYTENLTLWQHQIIHSFAQRKWQGEMNEERLLEARRIIQRIVDKEYASHKSIARKQQLARLKNKQAANQERSDPTTSVPSPTKPQITAGNPYGGISDVGDRYGEELVPLPLPALNTAIPLLDDDELSDEETD